MKRKGISLIVLVITIVVIIILAAAVILSLGNNNPINSAKEAQRVQDFANMQAELEMYISTQYTNTLGNFDRNAFNANKTTTPSIVDILPSIKGTKYENTITVVNGKLVQNGNVDEESKEEIDEALKPQKLANMKIEFETYISNNLEENERDTFNADKKTTPSISDILPSIKGTKYEDIIYISNGNLVQKVKPNEQVAVVNATVTGKPYGYNNPVIPVGFKTLETSSASWNLNSDGFPAGWNEGLVVLDEENNEYVWIPVYSEIEYSKRNSNVNDGNKNYAVTFEEVVDDTLPNGIISEQDQITKYGGFYVARYEAGLPDNQTTEELMKTKTFSADDNNKTTIGKAQSKENKIVWNRINYTNAKIVAENVISNDYVQTGLLTSTQWDTMCKFIEKAGVDVLSDSVNWGNYKDKINYTVNDVYYRIGDKEADIKYTKGTYTKSADGYLLLPTGIFAKPVEDASPKNLFDVAGNVWEFTAEKINEIKNGQAYVNVGDILQRGGGCDLIGRFCACYRYGGFTDTDTHPLMGFRFALYVK